MFPIVYNNGNQILQTPRQVVLRNEVIHETRVIPLDAALNSRRRKRSYTGDSRGRWDGDTLDKLFEYACHERNYAMKGIRSASRTDEQTK